MTKTTGVLTPQTRSPAVISCQKCVQVKKQAENAFRELTRQTDSHIDAIQKQLSEEYGNTMNELKEQYDELFAELAKAREVQKANEERHEKQLSELKTELIEAREIRERVVFLEKKATEDEIKLETAKSQIQKLTREYDGVVEKIRSERDDAVLDLNRLMAKAGAVDSLRQEYELERARADLAYRKRIGEMESEVRRTEIESVRLRKQILSLTQRIETYEHQGTHRFIRPPQLVDDLRRSRILSIESDTQSSGVIRRIALP